MCFIFAIPVHFIHRTIKISKYYFIFISLIFIFHIILYSFKETPPRQLFPGAIPWRSTNTENSHIRGSNLKGHKSVSTSVIASRRRWSRTSNPFARLSPGEKKWSPTNYFLYGVFDHGWYEFQLKYWWLYFGFCNIQVLGPASKDLWCLVLGLLKWLKESSFYNRKLLILIKLLLKINYYKYINFHKRDVHIKKKG